MPELLAAPPLAGLDVGHGTARLVALPIAPLWLYAPFPGAETAASDALSDAFGTAFPGPGEVKQTGDVAARWAGRAQALLIGPEGRDWRPDASLSAHGATTDVTDVYARMMLSGASGPAVLARLVPLDLRPARFPDGTTARSLLGHASAQITTTRGGFEIMVMRSFAHSAAHEIETAMTRVAARP